MWNSTSPRLSLELHYEHRSLLKPVFVPPINTNIWQYYKESEDAQKERKRT